MKKSTKSKEKVDSWCKLFRCNTFIDFGNAKHLVLTAICILSELHGVQHIYYSPTTKSFIAHVGTFVHRSPCVRESCEYVFYKDLM